MSNVFQNLTSAKRVLREIRMLDTFRHDNIICLLDILRPRNIHFFEEVYILTDLMETDLHHIIASKQPLHDEHYKLLTYQLLRGIKYLHSANIIHRDLKPANLLVNQNCLLRICDFGLARLYSPLDHLPMTHEVVTQHYRAPELLMGAQKYTSAIDMWSVGCIFAELVSGKVLFDVSSPVEQLDAIIDLLGTPSFEAMKNACPGAICHVQKIKKKIDMSESLIRLSPKMTSVAVDFLRSMLKLDPSNRVTAKQALGHEYIRIGRNRFHTHTCTCCFNNGDGKRIYTSDFEPDYINPFSYAWEKNLSKMTMFELRDSIREFITRRPPLCGVAISIDAFENSQVYIDYETGIPNRQSTQPNWNQ